MLFPKFSAMAFLEATTSIPQARTLGALDGLGGCVIHLPERLAKLSPEQLEVWEERTAIMEYEGGLPRAEAEEAAYGNIITVDFRRKGHA